MNAVVAPTPKEPTETAKLLTNQPHAVIITAMLWAQRNRLDNMAMVIPDAEVEAFRKSLDYNEQKPKLVVEARNGYTVVRMEDATTGNAIVQSESDEKAQDRKEEAQRVRAAAQQARGAVEQAKLDLQSNTISNSTILELCDLVSMMAKELTK